MMTRAEAIARGLKRYFTGRPCIHGHICERRLGGGVGGVCIECDREDQRRRFAKNHEKILEWQHQFRAENREILNARARQRYAENLKSNVNAAEGVWRKTLIGVVR
jgi:hypothetical protein